MEVRSLSRIQTSSLGESLVLEGILPSGGTATISVRDASDDTIIALDSSSCTESIAHPGKWRWSTSNITTQPTSFMQISARMTHSSGETTDIPIVLIGGYVDDIDTVDAIADGVWDETLTGAQHNVANSAGRRLRAIQEYEGYALGAIWIDTVNGLPGTTTYENGTSNNPVNSWADALTLAAATGLFRFIIAGGSALVLTAASTNYLVEGHGYDLDLNGQNITGTHIAEAILTGTCIGTGDTHYHHCNIGNVTLPPGVVHDSEINGTITLYSAGQYFLYNNTSDGNFILDFGAAVGNCNVSIQHNGGNVELQNIGQSGVDEINLSGSGNLTINANCIGGTINVFGSWNITDNGSATVNNYSAAMATTLATITAKLPSKSFFMGSADSDGGFDSEAKEDINGEVDDVLSIDANTELTAIPGVTSDLRKMIQGIFQYLFLARNMNRSTGVETMYKDDDSTPLGTKTHSDDGTEWDAGKLS